MIATKMLSAPAHRQSWQVARILAPLARHHQYTPISGHKALPTTLGFKVAVWLDEFLHHLTRLSEIQDRVLVGNINGAVSTYTALGPQGLAVDDDALTQPVTPQIGMEVIVIEHMACIAQQQRSVRGMRRRKLLTYRV